MIIGYVKGQELKVTQPVIVADTIDYLTALFTFSTADWLDTVKWAHFKQGETVYDVMLTDDKILKADHLNLTDGEWGIYLHGNRFVDGEVTERITTEVVKITVGKSGVLNGEPLPEIPATAAEQIVTYAQRAVTTANAVKAAADAGEFNGKDGYTPIKGIDYVDGKDAKINGLNALNIVAGENVDIEQTGDTLKISAKGGGGGGTSDHSKLSNRDAEDQHPMSAITGLQDALDDKQPKVAGKGLSTNDYDNTAKSKVNAIPANPKYTDTVYDDTELNERVSTIEGKEAGWDAKGTYSKPVGGIPKTDLASDVQESLDKADTALQKHQSLAGYATEDYVNNAISAAITDIDTLIGSGVI